jgi:hypothetical protein
VFLVSIIFQDFARVIISYRDLCIAKKLTVNLCLLGIRGEASQDDALPLTWSADCELAADDYTVIAHCSCQDATQDTGYDDGSSRLQLQHTQTRP